MTTPPLHDAPAASQCEEQLHQRIAELEARLAFYEGYRLPFETLTRLAEIAEITPDVIGMADMNSRPVYLNQAARKLRGISPDADISELSIPDFHPPWAREKVLNEGIPAAIRDDSWSGETALLARDGSEIPTAQVIIAHRDANNEIQYLSTILHDLSESRRMELAVRESERTMTQLLDSLPLGVFVLNHDGRPFYANQVACDILGKGIVASTETSDLAEVYQAYRAGTDQPYPVAEMPLVRALAGESVTITDMEVRPPGQSILLEVNGRPIRDANGALMYALAAFRDITEQRQAEESLRRQAMQEEIIRAQAAALAELSTPLLAISDRVVVMPLVGAIDSTRAQQVMEALLTGVSDTRAAVAIIDITGVSVVDTQVANALIRAAQAVKLLGARVVLTGIRPEIAQTLVGLGVDLGGLTTRSTLQAGIAFAISE
jgi:rsbT co-antagonist protein RsbR